MDTPHQPDDNVYAADGAYVASHLELVDEDESHRFRFYFPNKNIQTDADDAAQQNFAHFEHVGGDPLAIDYVVTFFITADEIVRRVKKETNFDGSRNEMIDFAASQLAHQIIAQHQAKHLVDTLPDYAGDGGA